MGNVTVCPVEKKEFGLMKRAFDPQAALRELVRDGATDRFDIAIDYHGQWFYQRSTIDRIELVRLFASVLNRASDGSYWLLTPVERGRIEVADAPFLLSSFKLGEVYQFHDNLGRCHKLMEPGQFFQRARADGRGDVPYLDIGNGVEARLIPTVFYELVETAHLRDGFMGFTSNGHFFALGEA